MAMQNKRKQGSNPSEASSSAAWLDAPPNAAGLAKLEETVSQNQVTGNMLSEASS